MMQVLIYGASGHAEAVVDQILNYFSEEPLAEVVGFIDDFDNGHQVAGVGVYSLEEARQKFPQARFNISVGNPEARKAMAQRVLDVGGAFMSIHKEHRYLSKSIRVGEGCSIFLPNYVSSNVTLKDHVQIMPNCSIAHDVTIGNYSVVCPSVTVSGYVHIGEGCFIGAGSTVANGAKDKPLTIGDGAYVGLGSVVTKSVPAGAKVFGNPARSIARRGR